MSIDFKELNRALDAEVVLNIMRYNKERKQQGADLRIRCTIHDSDNQTSLEIDTVKNLFYCHNCQAKGDLIQLYAESTGLDVKEAAKQLASSIGYDSKQFVPAQKINMQSSPQKKEHFQQKRAYPPEKIIACWNIATNCSEENDTYFVHKKLSPPSIARFGKGPNEKFTQPTTIISVINIEG